LTLSLVQKHLLCYFAIPGIEIDIGFATHGKQHSSYPAAIKAPPGLDIVCE